MVNSLLSQQANPKRYDIAGALRDGKLKTWGVKNHKKDIAKVDKAIVWVTGADARCYALCEIVSGVLESEASDGDEQSLESVIEAWQVGRVEKKSVIH